MMAFSDVTSFGTRLDPQRLKEFDLPHIQFTFMISYLYKPESIRKVLNEWSLYRGCPCIVECLTEEWKIQRRFYYDTETIILFLEMHGALVKEFTLFIFHRLSTHESKLKFFGSSLY